MIQLINVNKRFGDNLILEDLNLIIKPNSIIGLVGPNGAGKSTILRLISGVIQADAGIVAINEYDIFDNDTMKENIYFLADDPFFFNQSSLSGMKDYIKVFYKNFDDQIYTDLIEEFKISETASISSFSKGMKRQAALIIAISSRPKILLMDESFDGLDPVMRFKLKQNIIDQLETSEIIVIISSHSMSEVQDICDQVILVSDKGIRLNDRIETIQHKYHKFQLVFTEKISIDQLSFLKPLSITGTERIFTLIIKGVYDEIMKNISTLDPIVVEHSTLSLDEIYRLEMDGDQ